MSKSLLDYYLRTLSEMDVETASCMPYDPGPLSDAFVHVKGTNYWRLKRDAVGNEMTQDILVVLDSWALPSLTDRSGGGPGGWYAEGGRIWVPFLDGGVYVETLLREHETTNRMSAYQKTFVVGKQALRRIWMALTEPQTAADVPKPMGDPPAWPEEFG